MDGMQASLGVAFLLHFNCNDVILNVKQICDNFLPIIDTLQHQ
jgi:hypothetical protein